ncbi:MAG TPA: nucleotidyltransferase family protein [Bacillales bacterium]|nr:nucleotidyltransferase family protein [Bacillales bacterium]
MKFPLHYYNKDLESQIDALINIVCGNDFIKEVLLKASQLELQDYYIGAGCITQTVWNHISGYPLEYGIKDIDFVYFDRDLSEAAESEVKAVLNEKFDDLPLRLDVKNEARVHLWYKQRFGYEIQPYQSLEAAINSWPTTATAIGLRKEDGWKVYAPYGLNDLFGMIVRANKLQITKEIYEKKVDRWTEKWGHLQVIPWE